jgi:hypothetical protein
MNKRTITILIIILLFFQIFILKFSFGESKLEIESFEIINKNEFQIKKNSIKSLSNSQNYFIENRGQLQNNDIYFYTQNSRIWFTNKSVWYKLDVENNRQEIVKQKFIGINSIEPIGKSPIDFYCNFFLGNNSNKWKSNVPCYRELYFENIYIGIDLKFYFVENDLKYDFIIHPSADNNQIRIRYEGLNDLKINNFGDLLIKTQLDYIIEKDLCIYQEINGITNQINGKFNRFNNYEYGFEILEKYNKNEILVIDPIVKLRYSTFLGGIGDDIDPQIAIDIFGNAYMTGKTESLDFPITTGVIKETYNGGVSDTFVTKLNQNGSKLLYSTFIGGNDRDWGSDIKVDSNFNTYVIGSTWSNDFPTTLGANDTSFNGVFDAFVLKLNHNGSKLLFSTFIGGSNDDNGQKLIFDDSKSIFITGFTTSSNFPITPSANDSTYNGLGDIFVLKLNHNGSKIIYSTYLGGSSSETSYDIEVDFYGNVFVSGYTLSTDFPITNGVYDPTLNGTNDGFVTKLNKTLSILIFSTYIGGNGLDYCYSIEIDSQENIIVAGNTRSQDFPNTTGSFDPTYNGKMDVFVLKLNKFGSSLKFSTFIGSNENDICREIGIDLYDDIFVTGESDSNDFPITPDAYNSTCVLRDCYILKLSSNGVNLLYSSFIGGSDEEWESKLSMDFVGNVFLTGRTKSSDFPTTSGVIDNTSNGNYDIFVLKFSFQSKVNITSLSLLKNYAQTDIAYAQISGYTLRINLTDSDIPAGLNLVRLSLDPFGKNIQITWNRLNNQFSKINDLENYITLESTSKAYNNAYFWTIDFNITFNWTYPDEDLIDIQAFADNIVGYTNWFNSTELFRVENDLVFNGSLKVRGEDNHTIEYDGLVRGGERVNWTGLTIVYENTTDVYPTAENISISIWDENGNSWSDTPFISNNFSIVTKTDLQTNFDGENYIINITGIPPENDATDEQFKIRIDGDNVIFTNPVPTDSTWITSSDIRVSIKIIDYGGGLVDGKSVKHAVSFDNGTSWDNWLMVNGLNNDSSILVQDNFSFIDGIENLVKWQALDTLGNGPAESEFYRILVDTENVIFSNPIPNENFVSSSKTVKNGISISDLTSGVDTSSIEYTISSDNGITWDSWKQVNNLNNGNNVDIILNLTFLNGTNNRIKWRASDIAGNGPIESEAFVIKVDIWLNKPLVTLKTPQNNSIMITSSIELTWSLISKDTKGITYDLYYDTKFPPEKFKISGINDFNYIIHDLTSNKAYYWTIIPKIGNDSGYCLSGVWSFEINLQISSINLISPRNGSTIDTLNPRLIWSIDYIGFENVLYDIQISNKTHQKFIIKDCSLTEYLFKEDLKDGETYYWKIVPRIGKFQGIPSETWSFKIDYKQNFGLELSVYPPVIEISPNTLKLVKATVRNTGKLDDLVTLKIINFSYNGLSARLFSSNNSNIIPNRIAEFEIIISTSESVKKGEIFLTIIATSEKAAMKNITVEERSHVRITILEPDKDQKDNIYSLIISGSIIFLIIILILIITFFVFIHKRKEIEDEDESLSRTVTTIKPSDYPIPELSAGKDIITPLLDKKESSEIEYQMTSKIPQPSLTDVPKISPEKQISSEPKLPLLPPAENIETESQSLETDDKIL